MKKYPFITKFFVALLLANASQAQKLIPHPPVKPAAQKNVTKAKPATAKAIAEEESIIKDTFAYNLQTIIRKVCVYAVDPSKSISVFTEKFIAGKPEYPSSFYSTLKMPGAFDNIITRLDIDRKKGDTWEWTTTLIKEAQYTRPDAAILAFKKKLDSIITTMPPLKGQANLIVSIKTADNLENRSIYKTDEVTLTIRFIKANVQTEQQAIDSLIKLYRPGFNDIETTKSTSAQFTNSLNNEALSKEKINDVFAKEIKLMADRDIKIAYQAYMNACYIIEPEPAIAYLSYDQKKNIREIATAQVNAFYNQTTFDLKTFTPGLPAPPVTYTQAPATTFFFTSNKTNPKPKG